MGLRSADGVIVAATVVGLARGVRDYFCYPGKHSDAAVEGDGVVPTIPFISKEPLTAMSSRTVLTPGRVTAAFSVAVLADILQLPLNLISLTGFFAVPSEVADLFIDGATCIAVSILLGGFHWAFAPVFVFEAVPLFDSVPTWTAAVAIVVAIRRRQAAGSVVPYDTTALLSTARADEKAAPRSVTVLRGEEAAS